MNEHYCPSRVARLVKQSSELANRHGFYLGPRATKLHVALYRLTGGNLGGHVPGWPHARILLLDHTGARTGARRTSPLIYLDEAERLAVAASKAGQPTHPAWYRNLRAHPEATVQIGRVVRPVRARVANNEERALLWPKFVALYPSYDFYARNAGDRTIPVVILEPR